MMRVSINDKMTPRLQELMGRSALKLVVPLNMGELFWLLVSTSVLNDIGSVSYLQD